MAQTLGAGFLKNGYEIMLGTRDTTKLTEWQANDGKGSHLGSFSDAAAFGNILVLAVKGTAAIAALELAGEGNFTGKTIIDTCNPIAESAPENGVLKYWMFSVGRRQISGWSNLQEQLSHYACYGVFLE